MGTISRVIMSHILYLQGKVRRLAAGLRVGVHAGQWCQVLEAYLHSESIVAAVCIKTRCGVEELFCLAQVEASEYM